MAKKFDPRAGALGFRKGQKNKGQSSNVPGKTKTDLVARPNGIVPVPVRRSDKPRSVVPGTTANHTPPTIPVVFFTPSAAIRGRILIISMPAIRRPFPYIDCLAYRKARRHWVENSPPGL